MQITRELQNSSGEAKSVICKDSATWKATFLTLNAEAGERTSVILQAGTGQSSTADVPQHVETAEKVQCCRLLNIKYVSIAWGHIMLPHCCILPLTAYPYKFRYSLRLIYKSRINISCYIVIQGYISTSVSPLNQDCSTESMLGPSAELHHSDLALYKKGSLLANLFKVGTQSCGSKELAVSLELRLRMHDSRRRVERLHYALIHYFFPSYKHWT